MAVDLLPAGWITASEAQSLTRYNAEHLARLARKGQVDARKVGSSWVFNQESLLTHRETARPGRKPITQANKS